MTERTASWHCHHDRLCEWDTESRESRIAYIKAEKPIDEQPLRLRLYQPMSAEGCRLLAEFCPATDEADRVWGAAKAEADRVRDAATDEADGVWDAAIAEADRVRGAAIAEAMLALEALHKIECPNCPWDGETIFPKEEATP